MDLNKITVNMDDKLAVIFCASAIALFSLFLLPPTQSSVLVGNIISGLFGVAVGKSLENGKTTL